MKVRQINDVKLNEELRNPRGPLVVMFHSTGCDACRLPRIEFGLYAQVTADVRFREVDLAENPKLAGRYEIQRVPCVIVFAEGAEVGRHSGRGVAAALKHLLWARKGNEAA